MEAQQSPWLDWFYKAGIAGFVFAMLAAFIDALIQIFSEHGTLPETNPLAEAAITIGMLVWFGSTVVLLRFAWQLVFPRPLNENQYKSLFLYYLMTVGFFVSVWYVIYKAKKQGLA
jgi:uncharacterized membrane protein